MSRKIRISWRTVRVIVDCLLAAISGIVDATAPDSEGGSRITRAEWMAIAEDAWERLVARGVGVLRGEESGR